MELLILILYVLSTITLLKSLHLLIKSSKTSPKLPPGPVSLPIIGSLLKLGDKPHKSLAKLAKIYGPIMYLKLGRKTTVVISSPALAKEVLQKQDLAFSTRSIPNAVHAHGHNRYSTVWLPVADQWRSLRKALNSNIFSGSKLEASQNLRRQKVQELIEYAGKCCQEGVSVDIGSAAFKTSLNLLSNTVFSIDMADPTQDSVKQFRHLIWQSVVEIGKPNLVDYFPILEKIDPQGIRRRLTNHFGQILELFSQLINERLELRRLGKSGAENAVIDILLNISETNGEINKTHIEHLCLVLRADVRLNFVVSKISINRNGSALLLAGPDGLSVMYLYVCTSTKDGSGPSICRTVSIGSQIYSSGDNVIRTLKISWHPCSDTHMGILSSDSVFRIFDLSSALEQPEQEYYLQPVEPGRCRNAASICPVDFSFGSDHLWDRFSVFVLFSDGSVYILCPVVPFGSVYKWESILEIYHDAQTFGLESSYSRAVSNSNMAITWLEATFPELSLQETGGIISVKAQPYALFDASISLQGPLPKVGHGGEEDTHVQIEECGGRAVSLLYNAISKDSILVTAWSGGQLQIDALADEIQPAWIFGTPPRICVNSHDFIVRVAMICESVTGDPSSVKLYEPSDQDVWSGYPPPLLRLAIVDLALPRNRESTPLVSMVADPLIPERIFTLHDGGIDSIVLHFLPFTNQISGKNESMRTPSVHPVLCTSQGGSSSPLIGFLVLSDSYGYSWIVGLASSRECIVLEMKALDPLLPVHVEREEVATLDEARANDNRVIISKELLSGPKAVLLPPSNLRPVTADSIEGQSTLHHYFKLFHENYVEYAHKVYIELKHHGPLLKEIIEDQHGRLLGAQQKLLKVEEKQEKLEDRITHATQVHSLLKERLQRLRNLPGVRQKPLSKAEREFKSELDRFTGVELDALHSSIEALNARLRRYAHSLQGNPSNQRRQISGRRKNYVQDDHISLLKSSLAKLSLVNSENIKKVKTTISVLGDPKPSALIGVAMSNAFMPVVSDDRLQEVVDEEESHPSQVDASPRGVTPSDCEENDVLYSEVHVTPTRVIPAFAEHTPLSIDQQARHPPPVPSVSCRVVTESAALRNEGFDDFASITQSSGQQDPGELLSSHLQSEIQDEEDQGEDASEDMPHSKVIAGVCVGVEYYPILEEIERRFPDVFSNLFSVTTWLTYGILISFASFMKEVRYTRVDDLDASKIQTFLVALKEFEQMGLDVSWIRPRFEEVQRLNNLRMFAQDLEASKAFVIERERELTKLKADVARREGKLANAKRVAPTSLVDGDLVLKDIF